MPASAELTGFPEVIRCKVFQGTTEKPGRAIVITRTGNGEASNWPAIATLTMQTDTATLVWSDMRVVGSPRARRGVMHITLEDSRWKLRRVTLGKNYNLRDGTGNVLDGTNKNSGELGAIICDAAGLSFNAASDYRFDPPANFRGKRGDEAMRQLLNDGVCRLIYNPITQSYKLWAAGKGPLPDLTNAMFRPAPNGGLGALIIRSAPELHEGRLPVTAVIDNGEGEIVTVATFNGDGYFDGFIDQELEPIQRSRLREMAFRLWRVDSPSGKEILPHRALSLTSDAYRPGFAAARLIAPDLASQMREFEVIPYGGAHDEYGLNGTGSLFIADDPFLMSNGGSLKTDAELLVAYYVLSGDNRVRPTKTKTIGLGGGNKTIDVNWIRPIDSDEDDIGTNEWEGVFEDVAEAYREKYQYAPQTITFPGLPAFVETGRLSGAIYELRLHPIPQRQALTRLAFDFDTPQTMVR